MRPSPTSPRRLLLPAAAALLLAACGTVPQEAGQASSGSPAAPSSATTPAPPSSSPASGRGTCEYTQTGDAAKPVSPPSTAKVPTSGTVRYVMTMSEGDVTLTLDRKKAPCTVHSFESLVAQGFYDGTRCHRLTDSGIFVLQCGDPTGKGSGGPGYTYADETDGTETYPRGTVAMANAGPNTNGSQFFLVWDATDLPPSYTVFGTMNPKSRDVVAGIASQGQDGSNPDGSGKPNSPAKIVSVRRG